MPLREDVLTQAMDLLLTQRALWSAPPEIVLVSALDFPELDLRFYDKMRGVFEGLGFVYVGDFENRALSAVYPQFRTFTRHLLSADGTTLVGCWDAGAGHEAHARQLPHDAPADRHFISIETMFTSGSFLSTSTAKGLEQPARPGVIRQRLTRRASPAELTEQHRRRLDDLLVADPALEVRRLHSAEDVLAEATRQHELERQHRRSVGYVNDEFIDAVFANAVSSVRATLKAAVRKIQQTHPEFGPTPPTGPFG